MSDYGTAAGVALIARKYANAVQAFDAGTTPTGTQVGEWLDQVSALLNVYLADARFSTPISHTAVKPLIDMFANRQVANMVEALHLSHRSGPIAQQTSRGVTVGDILAALPSHVETFVKQNAGGMEAMGAGRGTAQTHMGSVPMTRTDGYSDDIDSWEVSYTYR